MSDAPAATSLLISAAALLQSGDTVATWEKPLARAALHGAGGFGRRLLALSRHAPGRVALRLLQRCALPGIVEHYRWRKRRIARWVEEALQAGTTQLIVLGAGFDPLGAWIAVRHPHVRVIEADRAATLGLMSRAMACIGLGASNLRLVATDLAGAAPAALAGLLHACEPRRTTLVIAEGVLMYLPQSQAGAVLQALRAGLRAPVSLVATAMQRDWRGRIGFSRQSPLVRRWLQRRGEPFRWGVAEPALAATLSTLGIALESLADPRDAEPDPCPGEFLFRGRLVGGAGVTLPPSGAN